MISRTLYCMFQREWWLCRLQLRYTLNSLLFFLMVALFFPLSLPAGSIPLPLIAPGVFWVSLLLATLLSSDKLFHDELEEGVIEQWRLSSTPFSVYIFIKLIVNWLWLIIPLILSTPVFGMIYNLSLAEVWVMIQSFTAGSPALIALGAMANAFALQGPQRGLLMALILLPLTIPILILGAGVMEVFREGGAVLSHLSLLMAISVLGLGLLPFAISAVFYADL